MLNFLLHLTIFWLSDNVRTSQILQELKISCSVFSKCQKKGYIGTCEHHWYTLWITGVCKFLKKRRPIRLNANDLELNEKNRNFSKSKKGYNVGFLIVALMFGFGLGIAAFNYK